MKMATCNFVDISILMKVRVKQVFTFVYPSFLDEEHIDHPWFWLFMLWNGNEESLLVLRLFQQYGKRRRGGCFADNEI